MITSHQNDLSGHLQQWHPSLSQVPNKRLAEYLKIDKIIMPCKLDFTLEDKSGETLPFLFQFRSIDRLLDMSELIESIRVHSYR